MVERASDDQTNLDISRALEGHRQALLSARVLKQLDGGTVTERAIFSFLHQYAYYCDFFPRALSLLAYRAEIDQVRFPLIVNLWEEHGSGDLADSHRNLYARVLRAINLHFNLAASFRAGIKACTRSWIGAIDDAIRDGSVCYGLGVLGPGTEGVTSEQYAIIASGLSRSGIFDGESLIFFKKHIGLDERHEALTLQAIRLACSDPAGASEMIAGAKMAMQVETEFWNVCDVE